MNIERLNHLITVLRNVEQAEKNFDLRSWGNSVVKTDEQGNYHVCGTSCCAMGYAAFDPVFQKAGLRMIVNFESDDEDDSDNLFVPATAEEFNAAYRKPDRAVVDAYVAMDDEGEIIGIDAAAQLFDISGYIANWLFLRDYYSFDSGSDIRPSHVIARLEYLIAHGEEDFQSAAYRGKI